MFHSNEHSESPETDPKETQSLDLLNREFKTTALNMFKELKENMNKEQKEIRKKTYK